MNVVSFNDQWAGVQIHIDTFNYNVAFEKLKLKGTFVDVWEGEEYVWNSSGLHCSGTEYPFEQWHPVGDKSSILNKYVGHLIKKTGTIF